ncbi:hypothetical protein [Mycobacterium sp. MFM001]|nr:hypothetical protein [Mycobacterium sp. MFM001]
MNEIASEIAAVQLSPEIAPLIINGLNAFQVSPNTTVSWSQRASIHWPGT